MSNQADNSLLFTLKQMMKCCQEIQESLKNDSNYFIKNQLDLIEESNQKKAELVAELNMLAAELTAAYPNGFMKMAEGNSPFQEELRATVKDLRDEITSCYKYIVANSGIIFSNLQQLKDIWDKVLAFKPKDVYDRTGSVV